MGVEYYFAPLEGITGYIYRRVHHKYYPGLDRYYTPFLVPKEKRDLSTKERSDILPEHNTGMTVVPQIMANDPADFLRLAGVLQDQYGYTLVNLNLGCPSKTVVSKKRGAGFLSVPEKLDRFLDDVCNGLSHRGMSLSVKTRIGKEHAEEFLYLLEIFGRYPISELIVHPRVQTDFYKNKPNLDAFAQAYAKYAGSNDKQEGKTCRLCYNGDIGTAADDGELLERFPCLSAVMIGRGLLVNPMLVETIKKRKVREKCGSQKTQLQPLISKRFADADAEKAERKRRYEMYRCLLEDYAGVMDGEKPVLFKMKELWLYMSQDFTQPHRYWKKMKKAQRLTDFEAAVDALCRDQRLL